MEITSQSGAKRWAESRARHLAHNGETKEEVPAPTLREFGSRWIKEYTIANGHKPSTIEANEMRLRKHLYPVLGGLRLNEIGEPEIQKLKLHLAGNADKTRACILALLATILRTAERWEEIVKAPRIDQPKVRLPEMEFYDFEEWEALIEGARRTGPMVLCALLLGGDAGLRRGELVALQWSDVSRVSVRVVRNEWEGHTGTTKSGKGRTIPLTARLAEAIAAVRHLRGPRLLWQDDGEPVGVHTLRSWLFRATKKAGLPPSKNLHKLRHTFCSHLAMRGAPARVIQELAGHANLTTTMRYMHLSKGSKEAAIALLEQGAGGERKAKGE